MNTAYKIQEFALPKQQYVKRIVYFGLAVLALSISLYVYFVGKIVFDVVGRRTAEASVRASQSEISANSAKYFAKMKDVDIAQAAGLGLAVSNDTLYATRALASIKTASVAMAHE